MKNFPKRLEILLSVLGLRQNVFAERLGVTPTHVSRLLKGGNTSPLLLTAISCVFKIERHWLETGEGNIFSGPGAMLEESAVLGIVKEYKADISRLNDHLDKLTQENIKLRNQVGKYKLAEAEAKVKEPKPEPFGYDGVANGGKEPGE